MSKKKVMLTGNLGFIFANFIRKSVYEKLPYIYCGVDKATDDKLLNNLYFNRSVAPHHFADISDQDVMDRIFAIEKPDIVIHAAAESAVDKSITEPNIFIKSNVLGTQTMLNLSVKYDVEKFIYISTDEVYGSLSSESEPSWKEDAPLSPRNPYSASKASGELLVKAAHETHGLNYIITRSCNNFGPRQTTNKLVPRVIQCILNNHKIPVYGNGSNVRDWLYVNDNCGAILKIMEVGELNTTYNISANQELSNLEVINKICNIMGQGSSLIEFVEDRKGHDFRYSIDSSKLKALGWAPERKFKENLNICCDWYKSNQWWFK